MMEVKQILSKVDVDNTTKRNDWNQNLMSKKYLLVKLMLRILAEGVTEIET